MTLIVSKNFAVDDMHKLSVAKSNGAYASIDKLLRMKRSEVVDEIAKSEIRGRGGAGFPVWEKWSFIPSNADRPVYLIVNADESEPGTFKDRMILERDPHLLIEGMIIAAYAIGAKKIFVYFRGEYHLQWMRFLEALAQAEDVGMFTSEKFQCDVIVYRGAGSYICGEETALIKSIEGFRPLPSEKSPYPAALGLFKSPTVIQNVETLCCLPYIISKGAESFAAIGTKKSKGTKLISVSGCVENPGVYEVPMGTPIASFLASCAGGTSEGNKLKAILPGGISTPVITSDVALGARIDFESMEECGSMLGTGGMIVLDDSVCTVGFLANLARFYSDESCGQCTPCREGSDWIRKILDRLEAGFGTHNDIQLIVDVAEGMKGKSMCPFSDALVMPTKSFIGSFRDEFEKHVKRGKCPYC